MITLITTCAFKYGSAFWGPKLPTRGGDTNLQGTHRYKNVGANNKVSVSFRFNLSNDVDLTTLAVKFELSGGFIKNALLSGLLSAIHRENKRTKANPSSSDFCPMLCQSDLEEGCKMQMRGFLSVKYSDSNVRVI